MSKKRRRRSTAEKSLVLPGPRGKKESGKKRSLIVWILVILLAVVGWFVYQQFWGTQNFFEFSGP